MQHPIVSPHCHVCRESPVTGEEKKKGKKVSEEGMAVTVATKMTGVNGLPDNTRATMGEKGAWQNQLFCDSRPLSCSVHKRQVWKHG
jgi:hypothetical protein